MSTRWPRNAVRSPGHSRLSTSPTPESVTGSTAIAPAANANRHDALALTSPLAQLRFWLFVAGGLTLDLWSKHWAFHTLRQGGDRELIPSVLEFHVTLNPGALFGLGAGQTTLFVIASLLALALVLWMFAQCPARRWLTQIALAAILAGALGNMYDRVFVRLVPFRFGTSANPIVLFCKTELTADGDKLRLVEYPRGPDSVIAEIPAERADELHPEYGYVRDFIKISQKWFGGRDVWPWVFNVADMLLVGGVGILAIRLLREREPPGERSAASQGAAAGGGDATSESHAPPTGSPPSETGDSDVGRSPPNGGTRPAEALEDATDLDDGREKP